MPDSGHVGYGEAPATEVIAGDTHESIVDALRHYIAPRLIGHNVADLNHITQLIQPSLERNSSAKAAVEFAIYDLWGQRYNAPPYKLLGDGIPVLTTDITIRMDDIDKRVADCMSAVQRGFKSLKIKVVKDSRVDGERVRTIYSAVEGRASLRLDGNKGWTAKQAVHVLQNMEQAGVLVERWSCR